MNQGSRPLSHYVHVLKRQAWLVGLTTGLAILAAFVAISTQQSVYRASMKIIVGEGGVQPSLGGQPLTLTMTNLFESEVVARNVIRNLGLSTTTEQLLKDTQVKVRPDSSVLNVTYDAPSKTEAVRVLSTYADVYTKQVDQLRKGSKSGPFALIDAHVWDPPHALPERVSPKPKKTIAFAAALGLVIGLILAAVRESLDDRIRTRKEAEELLGAPVIGALPKGSLRRKPPAFSGAPDWRDAHLVHGAEMLAASVQWSAGGITGPVILVTSAVAEEGKSTVAANLGVALALAGNEVVCVDADLRRPKLHEYLGLPGDTAGLAQVISADMDAEEALLQVPISANGREPVTRGGKTFPSSNGGALERESDATGRLRVLTAGRDRANVPPMGQDATSALCKRLAKSAAYVIIDAPPLLQISDAFPLAMSANSTLIVSREGRSRKQSAEAVRATLAGLGVRHTAVVVTDVAATDGYYG
jgi:polysaccharide biosynthesis transport protein